MSSNTGHPPAPVPELEAGDNSDTQMTATSTPSEHTRTTSPDTPPATGTHTEFPEVQTSSNSIPAHLSGAGAGGYPPMLTPQHSHIIPLDTPPPSGGGHGHRMETGGIGNLQIGASQSSVTQELGLVKEAGSQQTSSQTVAAWGNKKAIEEYEMAREKLVDQSFSLDWAGDDYNDNDMWQMDTETRAPIAALATLDAATLETEANDTQAVNEENE